MSAKCDCISASERKLDLFPLQRITSSDVILARTSQDAACSAACQTVKILFAPREIDQWFGNGMEEENTPTKTFIRVAVPENTCLQCGKLIDNPALRRKLFSGKQKTKTCQSLELLLGDVFPRDNDLGSICRNCSERNETLTKKIFQVRANFSGPKGSLANNLQSSVGVKRLTKAERTEVPEQGAIGYLRELRGFQIPASIFLPKFLLLVPSCSLLQLKQPISLRQLKRQLGPS